MKEYVKKLSFSSLSLRVAYVGDDCVLILQGGERPHIGCTVLAVPRDSLKEDGSRSSTASVINVTGHKDEELCRYAAERVAAALNTVTVCSGGFHMDHISQDQIREVRRAVEELVKKLVDSNGCTFS